MSGLVYEVEFFNICELEDIHTGNKKHVFDVNINDPIYGRYHMAKVTEQEYRTSRYYLLMTVYNLIEPECPTLADLLIHLFTEHTLSQEDMTDLYRVTATGETMTISECINVQG